MLEAQELQGITDSDGNEVTQGSGKYTVALDTDPGNTVTITLAVQDPTVATLEPQQLTFTSENWSAPQDVNITFQNDDDKDNDRTNITHSISGYAGVTTVRDMPLVIYDNEDPAFTEGETDEIIIRRVDENPAAGTPIGDPFSATDNDNDGGPDTLQYRHSQQSNPDRDHFAIDKDTGQLLTIQGETYDFETKSVFRIGMLVDDGRGGQDYIRVGILLNDVNDAPVFRDGERAVREVPENSGANVNVGLPLTVTDQDEDILTYTLSGADAGSFDVDGSNGQLRTKQGVSDDLESKASYSVTVTATDPDGAAVSTNVIVNLTDE